MEFYSNGMSSIALSGSTNMSSCNHGDTGQPVFACTVHTTSAVKNRKNSFLPVMTMQLGDSVRGSIVRSYAVWATTHEGVKNTHFPASRR